jgi:hypothetical protein
MLVNKKIYSVLIIIILLITLLNGSSVAFKFQNFNFDIKTSVSEYNYFINYIIKCPFSRIQISKF